ncbi:MAG: penicillin acylase family protein [Alphaproteobacteria bacterium]|nr:penicillin acylase family protein [Alphaproteobacteria bacterium]
MKTEKIELSGLDAPASITIDRWGIPHIKAQSFLEMFLVQGFNAARDRLWQLDLWRKRGLGLLAADYGYGYVEQDRAARLFLYRGNMKEEWAHYHPDAENICRHFVEGINAFIDLCGSEPERLPPEFLHMDVSPSHWEAADVVRIRSHSLMRNAMSEVVRSNILANHGSDIDELRQKLEPLHDPLAQRDKRPEPLPLDCLDVFNLAAAPVTFSAKRLKANRDSMSAWRKISPLGQVLRDTQGQGSNNWVVHGDRTDTGRPLLANDPHRNFGVPSLRYIAHLTSPEFNGIGAGEPALPGISIGHNGTAAFGLTLFFGHDQEDVFTYEIHPDDPELYRYGDGWEQFETIEEDVSVKGGGTETLRLCFSRHGPVVARYPDKRLAVAIRTVWTDIGSAPYFRSIASMTSTSFEEFRAAMADWGVPSVNQVYADTGGDIGWVVAGLSPLRPNWDGLLPVPGNGQFEWQGYLDGMSLPAAKNPVEGFLASANEYNLPDDWPVSNPIGYEWVEPYRAERIVEMFAQDSVHSLALSQAMQTDVVSVVARRLMTMLEPLPGRTEDERTALALLREWDCKLDQSSAPGALFEIWWSQWLRPALFRKIVDDDKVLALIGSGSMTTALDRLDHLERSSPKEFQNLMLDSLASAFADCVRRMGTNLSKWSWGRIHKAVFEHPVSMVHDNGDAFDLDPIPIGGSDSTLMNGLYAPDDYRLMIGASFRMVLDVGEWDNSVCINVPGQSGDPRSPHYGNLAGPWSRGEYIPLLYSETAIAEHAVHEIKLVPPAQ